MTNWKTVLGNMKVGDKYTIPYHNMEQGSKVASKIRYSLTRYNTDGKYFHVNLTFIKKDIVITRDS